MKIKDFKENNIKINISIKDSDIKSGLLKTFTFNDTTEAIKLFSSKIKSKVKKGYNKTVKGLNAPKLQGIHPNQLSFDFKFFTQISYS